MKQTMSNSTAPRGLAKQQDDPLLRACLRKKYIQETVILANKKLEAWSRSTSPPVERRKPAVKLNVSRTVPSGVKKITWKLSNVPAPAKKPKPPNSRRRIRKLTPEERESLYQQRPDLRPSKKNPSLEAEADVIDGATESRGGFSATRAIGSFFGTAVTALHEYAYGGASDSSDDDSDDSSQGSESSDSYASESNSEKSDNESTSSDLDFSPLRKSKVRTFETAHVSTTAEIESSLGPALRLRDVSLESNHDGSRTNVPINGEITNHPTSTNGTHVNFSHRHASQWTPSARALKGKAPAVRNDESNSVAKSGQKAMVAFQKNDSISWQADKYLPQPVKIVPIEHSSSSQAGQSVVTPSEGRRRRRREMKKQKSIGEIVSKFVNDQECAEPSASVAVSSKATCQMQSAEVLMDLVTSEPSTGALTKETLVSSSMNKKSPRRRRIRPTSSSNKPVSSGKDASLSNADILENLEAQEHSGGNKSHNSDKFRVSSLSENARRLHTSRKAFTVIPKHAETSSSPTHHRRAASFSGQDQSKLLSLSPPKNNDENSSVKNNTVSPMSVTRESDKRGPVALRSREFRLARLTMAGSSTAARLTESRLDD